MEYAEAARTKKPFGTREYKGKTLDKIASTETGLLHLDWLRGWFTDKPDAFPEFQRALDRFMDEPAIAADVKRAVQRA